MPRCLTCARIVDSENARCDDCTRADAAQGGAPPRPGTVTSDQAVVDSASPAAQAPSPAATGDPSSSPTQAAPDQSPPPASPDWSRRYLAWGLTASSAAAAVTIVLLRGGAADPPSRAALDQASLGPAIAREAPSVLPGAAIKWAADRSGKWVSNHTRSIAFELPAENTASSWLTRVRPILVVRCVSNTTDAFVYTQVPPVIEPRDDTRTVRLRFDDEDEHTTRWAGAADHDALFSPDPISFARRLARAQTLHFGFTPHNGPPATIVFDVRGFDARIGSIARTCRWK